MARSIQSLVSGIPRAVRALNLQGIYDVNVVKPDLPGNAPAGSSVALVANSLTGSPVQFGVVGPASPRTNFVKDLITGLRQSSSIALAPYTFGTSLTQLLPATVDIRQPQLQTLEGKVPMGFFDDIFGNNDAMSSGGFDAGLGGGGSSFDFTGLLNTGVGLANNYFGSQNRSQGIPMALTSATLPAVMAGGGMVVRGAMTALAARLAAVGLTRASAWSLLKSQGPTALLALGLTAAEVVTVARKGSGRRRMNMCNGRALRRAQRRLTSFHNFYKKTCGMPTYRHHKKRCK